MVTNRIQSNSLAVRRPLPLRKPRRQIKKVGRLHTAAQLAQLLALCSCAIALLGALAFGATEVFGAVLQSSLAGSLAVLALMLCPIAITAWSTWAASRSQSHLALRG